MKNMHKAFFMLVSGLCFLLYGFMCVTLTFPPQLHPQGPVFMNLNDNALWQLQGCFAIFFGFCGLGGSIAFSLLCEDSLSIMDVEEGDN